MCKGATIDELKLWILACAKEHKGNQKWTEWKLFTKNCWKEVTEYGPSGEKKFYGGLLICEHSAIYMHSLGSASRTWDPCAPELWYHVE